ncbi:hypothetical protein DL768_007612 [Monosporascus sp. mg162]|nr:hypothetical protein DL768_007612 [Monosporascus sp. mg162]
MLQPNQGPLAWLLERTPPNRFVSCIDYDKRLPVQALIERFQLTASYMLYSSRCALDSKAEFAEQQIAILKVSKHS